MVNASALPARYGIGKTLFYQRRNYLLQLGYNLEPKKDGNKRKYSDSQVQLLDELDKYIRENGDMAGFPSLNVHPSLSDERTIPQGEHPSSQPTANRELKEEPKTQGVNPNRPRRENSDREISLSPTNGQVKISVHDSTELTQTARAGSTEIDALRPETLNEGALVRTSSEQTEIECEQDQELYVDTNPIEDIKEQQLDSVHLAAQYSAAQNLAAFNYLTLDYMKHRDFTVEGLAEEVHKSEQAVRESFASMRESPEQATKKLLARIRQRRQRR